MSDRFLEVGLHMVYVGKKWESSIPTGAEWILSMQDVEVFEWGACALSCLMRR